MAEEKEEFVKVDPKLNPRNQAFAEIAKRANERQNEEAAAPMPPRDGEAPPVLEDEEISPEEAAKQADAASEAADKEAAAPEPEPTSQPVETGSPSEPQAIDPNADYDVTVDGKPIKVKGQKIIEAGFRSLQKESAADYRLQLATNMLEEAKRTVSQMPKEPPKDVPTAPPEVNDLQLAELIQFGTKEQAAEAVKLLRQQNPKTVTTEEVQQFVYAQLMLQKGADFAKTEYADLLGDPYLKDLFLIKEEQARKAGDRRLPADLYKAIGDDLRKHFNRPKAPTTTTMQERKDAKAKAPTVPRLASARLAGGEPQRPKTREEIIEGMRKARGQTSLSRS